MKKLLLVCLLPIYLTAFFEDASYYPTESAAITAFEAKGYKFEKWTGVTTWVIYDPPYSGQQRVWFIPSYGTDLWSASFKGCSLDSGRCIYHSDLIAIACKKGEIYNKSTNQCEPLKCNYNQYNNNGVCTQIPNCSDKTKGSTWNAGSKKCECLEGASNVSGVCTQELEDGDEGKCQVPTGSYVVPKTREFHEDIKIAGTDITLHYASSKAQGYKGANRPQSSNDIANGWSLSNAHHYEGTDLYLSDGTKIDNADSVKTASMPLWARLPLIGKILQKIIPLNKQFFDESHTGHEFDKSGKIVRSFDPASDIGLYAFSYDSKGYLISITDRFDRVIKLNRDGGTNKVTSITAPFGQITYLKYDSQNNLVSISYEDGSSYKFAYESSGLLTSKTDAKNNLYRYEYDSNGRVVKTIDPLYNAYAFNSNLSGDISYSSFTTPSGDIYGYANKKTDKNGVQLSSSKNPSGFETTVKTLDNKRDIQKSYCGISERLSYDIDPLSSQNTLSSVTKTMPSGLTNTQSFYTYYKKSFSKVSKEVSAHTINSKTTTVTTDYLVGKKNIISAEGREVDIQFDKKTALPLKISVPNSVSYEYDYNSKGQLTSLSIGDMRYSYSYDARGNIYALTDALGGTRTYAYDIKDRLISSRNQNGDILDFTYDDNDNVIRLTSYNSHEFNYSPLNAETSWSTPLGYKTSYEYDKDKRLIKTTKPSGASIQNFYKNGRLSRTVTNEEAFNYSYNCLGQITSVYSGEYDEYADEKPPINETPAIPASGTPSACDNTTSVSVIGITYNPNCPSTSTQTNGGMIGMSGGNTGTSTGSIGINSGGANSGTLTMGYGNTGSTSGTISMGSGNSGTKSGAIGMGYAKSLDVQEDLSEPHAFSISSLTTNFISAKKLVKKTSYTYDGHLLKSIKYEGDLGQTISFGYNNDFLVSSLTYANEKENLAYDRDGLLIKSNDLTVTRDKNNGNILSEQEGSYKKELSYVTSYKEPYKLKEKIGDKIVYEYSNTKNAIGKITSQAETTLDKTISHTYTYDNAGRLTKSIQEHKNIKDQSSHDYIEEFTYDSQGNILKHIIENNNIKTVKQGTYDIDDRTQIFDNTNYVYNQDGYLISKINAEETTSYAYDTLGNLKEVILPNNTKITYAYNANNQRTAKLINDQVQEKYLWLDLTTLLAVYDKNSNLIQRYYYSNDRVPYKVKYLGQIYYLSYNHQGTLKQVTDTNGQNVKSMIYSAYGDTIEDTNPNLNIPFGFAGGLYDKDTKLIKFGYRDHDPNIGKWITKDPIRFDGGDSNLYNYVVNDPVNGVDPWGLFADILDNPLSLIIIPVIAAYTYFNPPPKISTNSYVDDPFSYVFDPTKEERVKNNKGKIGYKDKDGCIWSKDRDEHGGSKWKKFNNKRDWNNGKREGSYDENGKRLRD
ncbi:MAG: hypothetical protein LBT96_01105 [Campylobacteraceae bacterium]|nr:hypothetical protein [Campylobacteraceae bacterium]